MSYKSYLIIIQVALLPLAPIAGAEPAPSPGTGAGPVPVGQRQGNRPPATAESKPSNIAPVKNSPASGIAQGITAVPSSAPRVLALQRATSGADKAGASQSKTASHQEQSGTPTGAQDIPTISPSKELQELRKFEESAFPRGPTALPPPVILDPGEGSPPQEHGVRSSAENPPEALRSANHIAREALTPAPPPQSWMSKLVLPDLPVRWDPKVIRYLEFYRTSRYGRAIMKSWLTRMGRYEELISTILHQHKMPKDLIYLAMVESGFNPAVTSRVGAAGIWQFMPRSGRGYGLKRDYWVDERRNPERSTEAAIRFLKDLYDRFGSWELALASYNAGYGAVAISIRKYNTNDYWRLCGYEAGLPWETSLYVPKILAVAIVGNNRAAFGFGEIKPREARTFDLVALSMSVTIKQAARAAGVEVSVIKELNPELVRGRTPPREKSWIRVPKGTGNRFYRQLAAMKGQLARYKPYVVRLGDSDREIARAHGISRRRLRSINSLVSARELRPGLTILVPARATANKANAVTALGGGKDTEGEGDSLIAAMPAGTPEAIEGKKRVFYRVTLGDSLQEIAQHLEVSAADLAHWNGVLRSAKLISGMILQAFVDSTADLSRVVLLDPRKVRIMTAGSEAFLNEFEDRKGRRRLSYTVRKGDSLTRISKRFGLSVGSLARINKFSRRTTLKLGQKIIVYVEKRKRVRKGRASRSTSAAKARRRGKKGRVKRSPLVGSALNRKKAKKKNQPAGRRKAKAGNLAKTRRTKAALAPKEAKSKDRREKKHAPTAGKIKARGKLKKVDAALGKKAASQKSNPRLRDQAASTP